MRNIFNRYSQLKDYWPALFFLAGFIWDAVTIGRNVTTSDLFIFAAYLFAAGLILYNTSRPSFILADATKLPIYAYSVIHSRLPYFILQFLFGSLLSALFILYFKSSSHFLAWVLSLILAGLLIANEFLQDQYKRFTVSWALFGLCAMLLFNFALPFLLGSVSSIWFYSSTLVGAIFAYWLYVKTSNHMGNIWPVWVIAGFLMFAYSVDMIPPVPLVKREIVMAYSVKRAQARYHLTQQIAPWWKFWRKTSDELQVINGQRIYCFSSIFAPDGLKTRLFHDWQHHTQQGWRSQSLASFTVKGGRHDGFRGYTYKTDPSEGDWRVIIKTDNNKTIAVHHFSVNIKPKTKHHSAETINLIY